MTAQHHKSRSALSAWVAAGGKVSVWCRANGVPIRTARRWTKDPKFQQAVETLRRAAVERTVGLLSKHAAGAVEGMSKLAKSAENEGTKLAAQRTILSELRDMTSFVQLERRMSLIEERLRADADACESSGAG